MVAEDPTSTVVAFIFLVIILGGLWKTFKKADYPGWGALIPIYNTYLIIKVADRPGWWLILYLIPVVSLIIALVVLYDVARNFGKGPGFAIMTAIFPFIGIPIIGFGDATYDP